MLLPTITIAAIVDSINPCAISVLLLTIGFLFSLQKSRSNILSIGLAYIAAIYLIYISIGLGILRALTFFGFPKFLGKFGAIFIITAGVLNIINHYFPKFPIKLAMPESSHSKLAKFIEKASIPSAVILGILVGLYEFPCTGGPYLTILGLLHDKATYFQGFLYLIYYNLIFILPLVVILWLGSRQDLFEKVSKWRNDKMTKLGIIDGLIMIILGVIILLV
ncbi:MAG: cytochrome c biogenesis protein CcdA [Patescibacteria group bacterium]